tara:strand:- start:1678 stop:2346 length:669 start_codon:yes stop_codon:yes gene_type:complete
VSQSDGILQAQEMVGAIDLGALLNLTIEPVFGYVFMLVGIALCLIGYVLYRFMIALTVAVASGTTFFIFGPTFGLESGPLWMSSLGVFLLLLIVGWLLYHVAVFIIGLTAGAAIGVWFWLLGAGEFSLVQTISDFSIPRDDLFALIATAAVPGVAIGIVAVSWERRLITLIAVILGGTFISFGIRYSHIGESVAQWAPIFAGLTMGLGLLLNGRRKDKGIEP